jgi:hypothetical protein
MNNLKTFYRLDQVSDIPPEDLLRYAIDGHLTLSVNLTKTLAYEPCAVYQEIDPLFHPDSWAIANKEILRVSHTLAMINPSDSKPLDVIINSGNVREVLELLFNQLPDHKLSSAEFILLEAVFKHGQEFMIPLRVATRPKADPWERVFRIPEDGYLVITKANLDAFKAKLGATIPKPNKDKKDLSIRNEAIRQDAKNGLTNPHLQKKYGLAKSTISEICNEEKKATSSAKYAFENVTRHYIK